MGDAVEVVAMDEGGAPGGGLAVARGEMGGGRGRSDVHAHGFHAVTLFLTSPGRIEWRFARPGAGAGAGFEVEAGRPVAGDVAVCPAGRPVAVRCERPFEAVSIRIDPARLASIADAAGFAAGAAPRPVGMRRDPFARALAARLADAGDGPGAATLADALGTALGVHLLREYRDDRMPAPPRAAAGLPAAALARVQAYVEANPAGDLAVDRLAALAGLDRFAFTRRFRASTGTTPHRYVLARRVEAARALILAGGTIADAALAAGFAGQSHLHAHARRLLGVTPGELAREARDLKALRPPP